MNRLGEDQEPKVFTVERPTRTVREAGSNGDW
jgi:hypothetical protein